MATTSVRYTCERCGVRAPNTHRCERCQRWVCDDCYTLPAFCLDDADDDDPEAESDE